MIQHYPSRLLEQAVQEFSKLPGIGRKTALRLVLHLLRQDNEEVFQFTEAISRMKEEVKFCRVCHNISDQDVCPICSNAVATIPPSVLLRTFRTSWLLKILSSL